MNPSASSRRACPLPALAARQPVFDRDLRVVGYELRHSCEDVGGFGLLNDFLSRTLRTLAEASILPEDQGGPAFIFLHLPLPAEGDMFLPLPFPKAVALEVFEADSLGPELAEALARLKIQGYAVALDGYRSRPGSEDMCRLADVVCLDLAALGRETAESLIGPGRRFGAGLWAKGVVTAEDFDWAVKAGFRLFSGPFFKAVKLLARRELSSHEAARLNILRLIEAREPDTAALTAAIESDVSVSLRLLTLVNSPAFGVPQKIASISQAVALVGWEPLRRWLRLVVLADLSPPRKTRELFFTSLQRALFLETLARQEGRAERPDTLYLLGLFSLLESILELPMPSILGGLPLEETLLAALCGRSGPLIPWLDLVEQVEAFSFEGALDRIRALDLAPSVVEEAYLSSISRVNPLMGFLGRGPLA